jgi:hypothetical protein
VSTEAPILHRRIATAEDDAPKFVPVSVRVGLFKSMLVVPELSVGVVERALRVETAVNELPPYAAC